MEQHLWVVEWSPGQQGLVPEPRLCPDFFESGLDMVIADSHFVVVRASMDEVQRVIADFPYWRIAGHPADGKWVGEGHETYILNGKEVDEHELWSGLGYKPEDFGVDDWADVDESLVYDQVPVLG